MTEPPYRIDTLYRGFIDLHVPEADAQVKINKFMIKIEQEHPTVSPDYAIGGIKMTYDWISLVGHDESEVIRATKKVYDYLRRFKCVRFNP